MTGTSGESRRVDFRSSDKKDGNKGEYAGWWHFDQTVWRKGVGHMEHPEPELRRGLIVRNGIPFCPRIEGEMEYPSRSGILTEKK
jgi:hypothetical protein